MNIPTILALVGGIVAGASGLAVAKERIDNLQSRVASAPEDIAAIKATLSAQQKRLDEMDTKLDTVIIQTAAHDRDDRR